MTRTPGTNLPTGTVTFLFTDIEASTALLAALGDAYASLLDRHATLLRQAFAAHGGIEVNTEGDAFFVAFASATAAVRAAADAQRALAGEVWPDDDVIRVRMGLHTGEGRLGGDDYLGLDVNRAARIAAAAHGGQVLVSNATHALVASDLPSEITTQDLGKHRLKDLPEPEHLWQLDVEGLATRFPAIRTLDARPTNLPTELTPLVGRAADLAALRGLLEARRVLTLTGPGGIGKTRLALATAASMLDEHPDGVFFVELEDARDRAAVATAIAEVLGVRERVDRGPEASIVAYLRERSCLLILDNFEQVISAASLVGELIAVAPGLRVIVTSREILRIRGEQEYPVPPLAVPVVDEAATLARLAASDSVALFVDRARDVRPDFELTDANVRHVAAIARRLDGLPLAIELAAARVRLLTPEAILGRLDQSLSVLGGGGRDRPGRQQTLRGAIDWSYGLLEDGERQLFDRLAVFAGGWTIEAAERVCVSSNGEVLEQLASLAEKSLIRSAKLDEGEPRFDMLGVIHEFAAERLAAEPAAEEVRRRHAVWVADLAERAEPELTRTSLRAWQGLLVLEQENVRAALRWSLDHDETGVGLRIAGPLWRYWHYHAAAREGRYWLEAVLALPASDTAPGDRARALAGLAGLVYWQGEMARAAELYDEALDIRRAIGDHLAVALLLKDSVWTSLVTGRHEEAVTRAREAIDIFRSSGAGTDAVLTEVWLILLPVFTGQGGDIEEAIEASHRAVQASRAAGRPFDEADWLSSIAFLELQRGDMEAVAHWSREALLAFYRLGAVGWMAPYFKLWAALELERGRYEPAVKLAAAAERYDEQFGGALPESMFRVGDPVTEAAAYLDPADHARAVQEGRAMPLDEAIAFVFDEAVEVAPGVVAGDGA